MESSRMNELACPLVAALKIISCSLLNYLEFIKLDGVDPVDNRPSTN